MDIRFIKMQAQGNDFLIIDPLDLSLSGGDPAKLALVMCNRHFGLGADGLVLLSKEPYQMVIYNADGSRAEMCGSALRCCCALLARSTGQKQISVKTDAGIMVGTIDKGNVDFVTVEMDPPRLVAKQINLDGFVGDYIDVGNPHFVVFRDDLSDNPHLLYGEKLSHHEYFGQGANIEFVKIIDPGTIQLVVWERGAGPTLACGTGSVASFFSAHLQNKVGDEVEILLPGGNVKVGIRAGMFYQLGGETAEVASGAYKWRI